LEPQQETEAPPRSRRRLMAVPAATKSAPSPKPRRSCARENPSSTRVGRNDPRIVEITSHPCHEYLAPGSTRSPELSGEQGMCSLIGPRTTPSPNSQAASAVPRNGCQSHTSPSKSITTRRGAGSLSSSTKARRSDLSSLWRPRRWSGGLAPMRHCPDQFEGRPPGKRATEVWCCSGLF
jgi:hypothetical protein